MVDVQQEQLDEAVEDALREERRAIVRMIRTIEFTADGFTFDVINSLLDEIVEKIERRP